ncbi:MAG: ethylbenzene dehydrogenase-related protein [Alphaproteobacteria bacterium]|jgi:DMSO reductase family type II enzyme heme b subunit|nr:ethylbenzene dehydrogenase-related protein [Alphaproteobacteria bacterium]MDP6564621.1 ethylbenzene dehydrogenase-related protein [Alphaproteobacteria bacterium]MDP6813007.1 ethylbenzene dehydrogenase-related protein [Alphaproteobacteria bacterium]
MVHDRFLVIAMLAALLSPLGAVPAAAKPVADAPMPEVTDAFLAEGEEIYYRRCSFCHGLLGDGEGPAAKYLDPRPRDFTLGTFKFRTTQSGELPQDSDLFRTVSRGLPGTGMQAFDGDLIKNGLDERQRWAVIAYIKTFAPEFEDEELDPVKTGKVVALPANRPAFSPELVAKGKEIFLRAKCWECHGKEGRGNGQKSFDRKDDWGFPIRIRNVTHPWKIKGGSEAEDIYMRFSTGISGTPMPSFVKALNEDERWALANFIKSLQHKLTEHQVLAVLPVDGEVPGTPDDGVWEQAQPMDVRLAGQVVAPPRWQNPSIEMVTLKAVANDREIAIRISWDDPFKDASHDEDQELNASELTKVGIFNSYVEANDQVPRALETFRDSIALQFSAKPISGSEKPHFLRGSSSAAVQLWHWMADREEAGERSVVEAVARGWRQPPKAQADDQQGVEGKAVWADGRWTVVMKRALTTEDKNDVQFVPGKFIPLAVNAWDGSNGEHGRIMSLSTWYYVFIVAPTPVSVYIYVVASILIMGGFGLWLVRVARNSQVGTGASTNA